MADRDDKDDRNAIIKKLSAKIIMGDIKIGPKLIIDSGRTELDLFRIVGIATDSKTGESGFGQWVALLGDFQSVNLITGEVMRSAKLFVPDVALEMIQAKMAGQGQDGRGVAFAFDIGVKLDESANSAKGYVYYAKSVIKPTAEDPMEKLVASLPPVKPKALPAPKASEAKK